MFNSQVLISRHWNVYGVHMERGGGLVELPFMDSPPRQCSSASVMHSKFLAKNWTTVLPHAAYSLDLTLRDSFLRNQGNNSRIGVPTQNNSRKWPEKVFRELEKKNAPMHSCGRDLLWRKSHFCALIFVNFSNDRLKIFLIDLVCLKSCCSSSTDSFNNMAKS